MKIFTAIILAALLVTSFIAFTLHERLCLAQEARQRDAAINWAVSDCFSAAHTLDKLFTNTEFTTILFAQRVKEAYLYGDKNNPMERNIFFFADFASKETAPSSADYADAYEDTIVDFQNLSFHVPDGYDPKKFEPGLRVFFPLKDFISQILLYSGSEQSAKFEGNTDRLIEKSAKEGMPVHWVYFALPNGVQVCYPANDRYSEGYDSRTGEWYRGAVKEHGLTVWGNPYRDTGDVGDVVITCSAAFFESEKAQKELGVAAIDVSLKDIRNKMSILGNKEIGFVIEKSLVSEEGKVIINFINPEFAKSGKSGDSIVTALAEDEEFVKPGFAPDVWQTISGRPVGMYPKREHGEEVIYVFSRIGTRNWVYVEKLLLRALIDHKGKELKDDSDDNGN